MSSYHQIRKLTSKLLLLSVLLLHTACSTEKPNNISVSLFIDVTSGKTISENEVENLINRLFSYAEISLITGGDNSVDFAVYQLNQLSESVSVKFHLEPGVSGLLGQNPLDRIEEIKAFDKELRDGFSGMIAQDREELKSSKIYQNLCREFNSMDFSADQTLILINSDMLENSELFSFYSSKKMPKLTQEGVVELLDKIENKDCVFPSLSGVKIVAVSQRTIEDDELINEAEEFWNILFDLKNGQFSMESDYNF